MKEFKTLNEVKGYVNRVALFINAALEIEKCSYWFDDVSSKEEINYRLNFDHENLGGTLIVVVSGDVENGICVSASLWEDMMCVGEGNDIFLRAEHTDKERINFVDRILNEIIIETIKKVRGE